MTDTLEYSSLILVPEQKLRSTKPVVIDELESLGGTIIAPKVTIKKLTGTKLFIHNNSSDDSSSSSSDSSSDEEHGSSSNFGNIGDNCIIGNFKVQGNVNGKRVGNIGNNCRIGNYSITQSISGISGNNSSIHIGGNTVSGRGQVKQTIGKVSGNNSYVSFGPNTISGKGSYKTNRVPQKTIVTIYEATNDMIDVQGDVVISGRVQTKDLDIGEKLTITNKSELKVDVCISVNECLVEENGVIQTGCFGCNVATFQENSVIKVSAKLAITTATVKPGAQIVAHVLELNSAAIKGSKIICDTKCKGTSIELWDSFMSAHDFYIGNLKLNTSTLQFRDKLKVNSLEMEDSQVKIDHFVSSHVKANSVSIKRGSILNAGRIDMNSLHVYESIVNVDVLMGNSVVVNKGAALNCAVKLNVNAVEGTICGPPLHKRQKIDTSLDHLKDKNGNVIFDSLTIKGDLVM